MLRFFVCLGLLTCVSTETLAEESKEGSGCETVMSDSDYASQGGAVVRQIAGTSPTTLSPGKCTKKIRSRATARVGYTIDKSGKPFDATVLFSDNDCWGERVVEWIGGRWAEDARFNPPTAGGSRVCIRREVEISIQFE